MTCVERDLLSEYADGALALAQTRRLEEHLLGCVRCQTSLGLARALKAAVAAAAPAVPPAPEALFADLRLQAQRALDGGQAAQSAPAPGRFLTAPHLAVDWRAVGLALAATLLVFGLTARRSQEVSLDDLRQAHLRYCRTLPFADAGQALEEPHAD